MSLFDQLHTTTSPEEFISIAADNQSDLSTALLTALPNGKLLISEIIRQYAKNPTQYPPGFVSSLLALLKPAELETVMAAQNQNKNANTVLHIALHHLQDQDSLQVISNLSQTFLEQQLSVKNNRGWHYLHSAARNPNNRYTMTQLIKILDQAKLSAAYADPTVDGRTVMHFAERYQGAGETKPLSIKVDKDALITAAAHKANDGWTGLHCAARNAEPAEFLIILQQVGSKTVAPLLKATAKVSKMGDFQSLLYMILRNQPAICIKAALGMANFRELNMAINAEQKRYSRALQNLTRMQDALQKNKLLDAAEKQHIERLLNAVLEFTNITRAWHKSLMNNALESSQIADFMRQLHDIAAIYDPKADKDELSQNEQDIMMALKAKVDVIAAQPAGSYFDTFVAWIVALVNNNPAFVRDVVWVALTNFNFSQLNQLANPAAAALPASSSATSPVISMPSIHTPTQDLLSADQLDVCSTRPIRSIVNSQAVFATHPSAPNAIISPYTAPYIVSSPAAAAAASSNLTSTYTSYPDLSAAVMPSVFSNTAADAASAVATSSYSFNTPGETATTEPANGSVWATFGSTLANKTAAALTPRAAAPIAAAAAISAPIASARKSSSPERVSVAPNATLYGTGLVRHLLGKAPAIPTADPKAAQKEWEAAHEQQFPL